MHRQEEHPPPSNPESVRITDDEIREKYLERAIREINQLTRDIQGCHTCPRGGVMPVVGSGHPQADIMLLKHEAVPSEVEEGVAFYGRAGNALMKALKRLQIDPLAVYGSLCVKCPVGDASLADPACVGRVAEEFAIVQPKMLVVMGGYALEVVNELQLPLARSVAARPGEIQQLTPDCDLLFTPDIDQSLDEEDAKRAFWNAFRVLGDWYADLPPY